MLGFTTYGSYCQGKYTLYGGEESVVLRYADVQYLPSGDSVENITKARNLFEKGYFIANNKPDLNLGVAKDNYWLRLGVSNSTAHEHEIYLVLENPRLNLVEVFFISNDSIVWEHILGDELPFDNRNLHYNQFATLIELIPHDSIEIFMYVKHKGNTLYLPLVLRNTNTFYAQMQNSYLLMGLISGIFILAIIFGLFFLFNTNDILFFYYSAYVFTSLLWIWATEGYGYQYFWSTLPEIASRIGPGIGAFSASFFLATCLRFCKVYDHESKLRRILYVILLLLLFWGLQAFFPFVEVDPVSMSIYLYVYFSLNSIIAVLLTIYLLNIARKGHTVVLYYLFAIIITILSSILMILKGGGLINFPLSSGLLMSIAYIVEITLMSAGITRQFYSYKKDREKSLLAFLEQQKSINARIMETQEKERNRISQELHDDIGPKLTQITLLSEALKKENYGNTTVQNELGNIANTSRELVQNMGEIIWSLIPENKSLQNLLGYLREQLLQLLEYANIKYEINFNIKNIEHELEHALLRNILLVTKEIVNNAVRHSKAENINIQCSLSENTLHFEIADDGIGMDLNNSTYGNGLRNIKQRIEESGGVLKLSTAPNKGTVFSYSFKL
jgi:signal transduction histidine kinase